MKAFWLGIFIISLCFLCIYITNMLLADLNTLLMLGTHLKKYLISRILQNRVNSEATAPKKILSVY
jgi:hypothetical protein